MAYPSCHPIYFNAIWQLYRWFNFIYLSSIRLPIFHAPIRTYQASTRINAIADPRKYIFFHLSWSNKYLCGYIFTHTGFFLIINVVAFFLLAVFSACLLQRKSSTYYSVKKKVCSHWFNYPDYGRIMMISLICCFDYWH